MNTLIQREIDVPAEGAGRRLDQVVAELLPDFSRSRLQRWIREGSLRVDGLTATPRRLLHGGERISLCAELAAEGEWQATGMELRILFEDEAILVIDKPPGLVVHPAAGHADDTLLNGLLAHCPELAQVPRAGIVHRLDRDTSGLLVVAKTLEAQTALVSAMQRRDIHREYRAVVNGVPVAGGRIDKPIGRHPRDRQRMAVLANGGKEAVTRFRVLERLEAPSSSEAQDRLEQLRSWRQEHRRRCWPLPPETGWAFAAAEARGRGWIEAQNAWEGGFQSQGEREDPVQRICFGSDLPLRELLSEPVQVLALELHKPLLDRRQEAKR